MNKLLLLMVIIIPTVSTAEVQYLNLEAKKLPFMREYMFPDHTQWDYHLSLKFRANIDRIFLESDISGMTTGDRFRRVWWDYTAGITVTNYFDLVWDHKSDHKIDWYSEKFEVRDSYGVRIKFIPGGLK